MGCTFHDALVRVMRRRAMGGGHVTRRDVECVHDETLGIGPGLSGCRDGFGTKHGMSHNSIPPSRPCLEAWEGWSVPVPRHLVPRNKRRCGEEADQDSDMPSAAELAAAIAMANANLVTLVQQQAEATEREAKEVKDVKDVKDARDTAVGSLD